VGGRSQGNSNTYNGIPQRVTLNHTGSTQRAGACGDRTRGEYRLTGLGAGRLVGDLEPEPRALGLQGQPGALGGGVAEDIAQAFGGTWKGKKLGSIGSTGCFSFFPSKNLGGFGDGGMVSTNDDQLNDLMRMLLKHGGKDKYNVDHIGYNARLDTLQAAVLLAKFKYIDEFNDRRRKIAELYNDGLKGLEGLVLPLTPSSSPLTDSCHVYHQYTVRVLNGKRDAFQKHLSDKGVSTMIYYPFPLHRLKVFGDGRSKTFGSLELSGKAALEVVSLPIEPLMKEGEILFVSDAVKSFF